ncbi:FAD-dependent oxidoreductase [Paenibacillus sp. J5C_2022]|uniref:FAD-dependent oxidoreductase n=1 Tax=Paenibacillus sp. J5C2022 TaxID=2977129 RepID=UPI0021D3942A|nr:FAD-dependent oxidoreductase [Paenibacillus sp. J5C2022]MCU6707337.1 FAD-dependent oxidoreductase [Paenibacillus sp. J5C2022]
MSFFRDFLKMFKKREIVLVESGKESEEVYTFRFKKDSDVNWIAGQHGLFSITHKKIKNALKPFTVSSAPTENYIQLTMRIGHNPSEFKRAMLELKPGMKVNMTGPVGTFHPGDTGRPLVMIAGGIGITPFRSILKQIEAEARSGGNPIHLLYLDSKQSYLFQEELEELAGHLPLHVTYLDTRDDLHREIDTLTAKYKNDGQYLIAGPKSMVSDIAAFVQNKQISKRNIKKDSFFGY